MAGPVAALIRWWSRHWQAYRAGRIEKQLRRTVDDLTARVEAQRLELFERDEKVRALESERYIQQREIELLAAVCARNVKRVRSETDRINDDEDEPGLRMTG